MHFRRKRPAEEDHHDPQGIIPKANARRLAHPLPQRPGSAPQTDPKFTVRGRRESQMTKGLRAPAVWRP